MSDSSRLFGLPYSDSLGYLIGALRLNAGLTLLEFSGRRPLYSGYLSSLVELTGRSLSTACIIQSILVGLALCWYGEQALSRFGGVVTALTVALISVFFLRFAGKTMTENLGLVLALLAWGFFYRWRRRQLRSDLLLGYLTLSLGLVARAGPFFMLPAILLCLARERPKPLSAWTTVVLCALAIIPFALARAYLFRFGSSETQGFSNFSYTLYGVARGGKGWMYANQVLGAHVTTAEVYRAALASIRSAPGLFAFGALRSIFDFFSPSIHAATGFASIVVPGRLRTPIWLVSQLAFLVGLTVFFRRRTIASDRFDLWAMAGVIASLPFAPPIDADAMRAHTIAIPLVATVCAVGVAEIWNSLRWLATRIPTVRVFGADGSGALGQATSVPLRFFPEALLGAIALLLIRPLLRHTPVSDTRRQMDAAAVFDTSSDHLECGRSRSFTLDHLLPPVRISSAEQLASTQRRHPYPFLFEPLKRAFKNAGPYSLSYALVEESGTVAAVALPNELTRDDAPREEPLRICADKLVLSPSEAQALPVDSKGAFVLLVATDISARTR
ncbi:MAG: hypothetical protein ABI627_09070 [Polyangiaceae bacterium]